MGRRGPNTSSLVSDVDHRGMGIDALRACGDAAMDAEFPSDAPASDTASSDADIDELDLASLDDDELVEQMHEDLYDGLAEEIIEGAQLLLERDWDAQKVLEEALVEGMRIVGIDFRDGVLFVPEVLLAANAMKGGMEVLRPLLAETGAPKLGSMVIGTVKGDIHDIGKNLVGMMMEEIGRASCRERV